MISISARPYQQQQQPVQSSTINLNDLLAAARTTSTTGSSKKERLPLIMNDRMSFSLLAFAFAFFAR